METQARQHGEIQVQRRLLEDDAQPRQCPHGIAPHVRAEHLHGARIRDEEAGEQLEQRGLARAVGTEQRDALALVHGERHGGQRLQRDAEFARTSATYMQEFEQLLKRAATGPSPTEETREYLLSDRGKVYTMLAHASGRLG